MPRRVEDIVPSSHRSIRNIPAPGKRKPVIEKEPEEEKVTLSVKEENPISINRKSDLDIKKSTFESQKIDRELITLPSTKTQKNPRKRKVLIWSGVTLGVVIVVGIGAYVASNFFSRAIFNISPRKIEIPVNGNFILLGTPQDGILSYQVMSQTITASTTVSATDGALVRSKAKGNVTLVNNYSDKPWKLIAGTRLSATNGNIYRLNSSVVIPAMTKTSAGSIVAQVVADDYGQKYNISREDGQNLNVVAYISTNKVESIYAKVDSDITGGFSGSKKTVESSVLANAVMSLQATLKPKLTSVIKANIPNDSVTYDSLIISNYSASDIGDAKPNLATISVKGTVYAVVIKKADLINRIGKDYDLQSFGKFPFDIIGLDTLNVQISNIKDFSPVRRNSLALQMKGTVDIVGIVPADQLKARFAGISLGETQNIMRSYSPVIDLTKSSGQIVPPWSKIPTNLDRIIINIQK